MKLPKDLNSKFECIDNIFVYISDKHMNLCGLSQDYSYLVALRFKEIVNFDVKDKFFGMIDKEYIDLLSIFDKESNISITIGNNLIHLSDNLDNLNIPVSENQDKNIQNLVIFNIESLLSDADPIKIVERLGKKSKAVHEVLDYVDIKMDLIQRIKKLSGNKKLKVNSIIFQADKTKVDAILEDKNKRVDYKRKIKDSDLEYTKRFSVDCVKTIKDDTTLVLTKDERTPVIIIEENNDMYLCVKSILPIMKDEEESEE